MKSVTFPEIVTSLWGRHPSKLNTIGSDLPPATTSNFVPYAIMHLKGLTLTSSGSILAYVSSFIVPSSVLSNESYISAGPTLNSAPIQKAELALHAIPLRLFG